MTTVHQAVAAVIGDLKGIGKNQRNKEQGYNFRGIDDVLRELHPLFAKHGVFLAPDVLEREYEERVSAKGTVGHCCHLHVRFHVYGPEGDSIEMSTWGEGLDYGDKSTNKAATAAYKYALFELFAVADPDDDGTHETPEASHTTTRSVSPVRPAVAPATTRRPPPRRADPETGEVKSITDSQRRFIDKLVRDSELPPETLLVLAAAAADREVQTLSELSAAEASRLIDMLKGDA